MSAARYRDVYIAGPDLVAPVLRGVMPNISGAPYRISPFFPPGARDVFAEVVTRIRAGALPGRQLDGSCWCALVSPVELAALVEDLYGGAAEPEPAPRLAALRNFVAALPTDCAFSLVALAF